MRPGRVDTGGRTEDTEESSPEPEEDGIAYFDQQRGVNGDNDDEDYVGPATRSRRETRVVS